MGDEFLDGSGDDEEHLDSGSHSDEGDIQKESDFKKEAGDDAFWLPTDEVHKLSLYSALFHCENETILNRRRSSWATRSTSTSE